MPGVPKELAEHGLHIHPGARPVTQSLRRFLEPKRKEILKELHLLQDAKFISEIVDKTLVANPVLVPNNNIDEERMGVDFTDLNKQCPKDHFPTP
jgi:DNA-binding transcriptional ArsR family regulator